MPEYFNHGGGDITLDVYPCTTARYHKVTVTWPSSQGQAVFYLNPNTASSGPHDTRDYEMTQGQVQVDFECSDDGMPPWTDLNSTGQVYAVPPRRVWAESDPPPVSQDENDANVVVT